MSNRFYIGTSNTANDESLQVTLYEKKSGIRFSQRVVTNRRDLLATKSVRIKLLRRMAETFALAGLVLYKEALSEENGAIYTSRLSRPAFSYICAVERQMVESDSELLLADLKFGTEPNLTENCVIEVVALKESEHLIVRRWPDFERLMKKFAYSGILLGQQIYKPVSLS